MTTPALIYNPNGFPSVDVVAHGKRFVFGARATPRPPEMPGAIVAVGDFLPAQEMSPMVQCVLVTHLPAETPPCVTVNGGVDGLRIFGQFKWRWFS